VHIRPYSNPKLKSGTMSKTRRNHSPQFKANVAVEALQGEKTSTRSPPSIKYQVSCAPDPGDPVAPPVDRGLCRHPASTQDATTDREQRAERNVTLAMVNSVQHYDYIN